MGSTEADKAEAKATAEAQAVVLPGSTAVTAPKPAPESVAVEPRRSEEPATPQAQEAALSPDPDAEIDADLAITLGRPKTAAAPSGNLASLLQGRSMLVTVEEKAEEEKKELSDTSHLDAAYDLDAIHAAWKALAEDLRDKNKVGLAATLTTGTFAFDDPTIRLTVANHVQYEEIKECAAELLHFMRVKVGSGRLGLDVQVSEAEVATTFMTPKDRYVKWAQDNPALETLRKRLDLDLG